VTTDVEVALVEGLESLVLPELVETTWVRPLHRNSVGL